MEVKLTKFETFNKSRNAFFSFSVILLSMLLKRCVERVPMMVHRNKSYSNTNFRFRTN